MSGQNKQWRVKPPVAARLFVALSAVGLIVFAFFLAVDPRLGARFTPWQRRLIALLIEIPGLISLIYIIILDWRSRRNLQESPARTIELSGRDRRIGTAAQHIDPEYPLMWLNRVWPKNLSPWHYVSLSVLVIFCLWVLAFRLDAAGARGGGLFFLVVGVFVCLTHRPAGSFMFKTQRALNGYSTWKGPEGAQASYLADGLVFIAIGCV